MRQAQTPQEHEKLHRTEGKDDGSPGSTPACALPEKRNGQPRQAEDHGSLGGEGQAVDQTRPAEDEEAEEHFRQEPGADETYAEGAQAEITPG